MDEEFVSKEFLNEFFLQLLLAHDRRKARGKKEKPGEEKEKEKPERLPFIKSRLSSIKKEEIE